MASVDPRPDCREEHDQPEDSYRDIGGQQLATTMPPGAAILSIEDPFTIGPRSVVRRTRDDARAAKRERGGAGRKVARRNDLCLRVEISSVRPKDEEAGGGDLGQYEHRERDLPTVEHGAIMAFRGSADVVTVRRSDRKPIGALDFGSTSRHIQVR